MKIKPIKCVKCGYCCTVRECSYGEWDYEKQQCKYLTDDTLCGKYEDIKNVPMFFNSGCSSSLFNTVREKKIKTMKETVK